MADLTQHTTPPTIQAIYRHYESVRDEPHRPHLGGSQIGHSCDRFLWYQFHWCDHDDIEGRILRLFDTGNREEDRLVADLRAVGVTVYAVDPETGKQWTETEHGGHFQISIDGVGHGFKESGAWHLLEMKTMNTRGFKELKKKGLEKSKPQYWAQVQIGMAMFDLDRTYHLTTCKENDAIYGERIKPDKKLAERLRKRAERVIFSEDPLERISERPDWYECKWCPMWNICHGDKAAEVNCRTCLHSTAMLDGTWHCAKHDQALTVDEQRAGCDDHLFRPSLVPHEQADAGEGWVSYKTPRGELINGAGGYSSSEIRANSGLPLDEMGESLRKRFGGEVVG